MTVKIISIDGNKLGLSIKALQDVAESETIQDDIVTEYTENEPAATSLGSLLSKIKID